MGAVCSAKKDESGETPQQAESGETHNENNNENNNEEAKAEPVAETKAEPVSIGLDLNGDGKVDVVISGVDKKDAGNADVLKKQDQTRSATDSTVERRASTDSTISLDSNQRKEPPATATVGLDLNNDGHVDVVVTGVDKNRDGIPDALEKPAPDASEEAAPHQEEPAPQPAPEHHHVFSCCYAKKAESAAVPPKTLSQEDPPSTADKNEDPPSTATVGLDLNHDGQVDVIVTGVDKNKDGIPDVLEKPAQDIPPTATVGLDLNNDGHVDIIVTGVDKDRDGIPDVLEKTTTIAAPTAPSNSAEANLSNLEETLPTGVDWSLLDQRRSQFITASARPATIGGDFNDDGSPDGYWKNRQDMVSAGLKEEMLALQKEILAENQPKEQQDDIPDQSERQAPEPSVDKPEEEAEAVEQPQSSNSFWADHFGGCCSSLKHARHEEMPEKTRAIHRSKLDFNGLWELMSMEGDIDFFLGYPDFSTHVRSMQEALRTQSPVMENIVVEEDRMQLLYTDDKGQDVKQTLQIGNEQFKGVNAALETVMLDVSWSEEEQALVIKAQKGEEKLPSSKRYMRGEEMILEYLHEDKSMSQIYARVTQY